MIEDSKDKKGFNYENFLGLGYSLNQNIKITLCPLLLALNFLIAIN
jgi:hypothetical protein